MDWPRGTNELDAIIVSNKRRPIRAMRNRTHAEMPELTNRLGLPSTRTTRVREERDGSENSRTDEDCGMFTLVPRNFPVKKFIEAEFVFLIVIGRRESSITAAAQRRVGRQFRVPRLRNPEAEVHEFH